ncbi:MAG: ATP-dependent RecD-like DNA helicase [Pseudomonadota bacterium]|nr:ATP-dependent RecD-like DNA helicase [Pseudomonadota bacterium]
MQHDQKKLSLGKEGLKGSVERITFHNAENGFCILQVKIPTSDEFVTIIGNAASVSPGEYVDCIGEWVQDRQFGKQFKCTEMTVVPPANLLGMEKYLGSGAVKGVGPVMARQLVDAFGDEIFDIISHHPERLLSLPGIGKKKLEQITSGWDEQLRVREIMVFLQTHGIGAMRAMRIYKTYGDNAIAKVKADPYRLALDIPGIGFTTADHLALHLGVPRDSLIRTRAGIRHEMQEFANNGQCVVGTLALQQKVSQLLSVPMEIIGEAIAAELEEKLLIAEMHNEQSSFMLPLLHRAECGVSQHIERLLCEQTPWHDVDAENALPWVQQRTGLTLSATQQTAVITAIRNKISVITGGPGVGKTTVVNSILQLIRRQSASIALCAPTGRAAKRLSESTHLEAKTIHRLLEFDPIERRFKRDSENPLIADWVVVDEASMIDIVLMHNLLKAIPSRAGLLLVGDVDQLPSVGPGAVLADVIASEAVAVVRLTEIFRQAESSKIIVNAHRINQGEMPLAHSGEDLTDFYFIRSENPEDIHNKVMEVVTERIPERFGLDPLHDVQVLTPMHRGDLGVRGLNEDLQKRLNPNAEPNISRFGWTFGRGDKVLQTVNNYEKEVFNGDIGFISHFVEAEQEIFIHFDGRLVCYRYNELDELILAYATTIHKSQGSEYPAVVIPLSMQHYNLLQRNLIYTAITRGKQLVVLIGQQKALNMALNNASAQQRHTLLRQRLCKIL